MSNLLLKWLNDDIQLSQHVESFEDVFASGYLLGEVLHRCNQQHNFGDFVPSETADAKIVNFSLLEPTLRGLGIKFDPVTATSIMNEEEGVAAHLVYQIKTAIERVRRSGTISSRPYSIGDVLPIHNVPSRLPKHTFDAAKHRSFESAIRMHVKAVKVLEQEKLAVVANAEKARVIQLKKAEYIETLEATRQQRLHLTKIQREFTQSANEGETEAWTAAQARRMEREDRKARYDRMVERRDEAKRASNMESAKNQVEGGIQTFEEQHIPPSKPSTTPKPRTKALPKQLSIGYGIRSLTTVYNKLDVAVPNASKKRPSGQVSHHHHSTHLHATNDAGDAPDVSHGLDAVRHKRQQRELRCDIQMKRRAKFVKKCDVRQRVANERLDLDGLQTELLRATSSERVLTSTQRNVLTYLDVVVENRAYRESKYSKRRKRDELDAITRDASAYGMIHHRYTDAVLAQNERYDRLTTAVAAATYKQHHVLCESVLDRVLDVVWEAATYRATSTWILPPTTFVPQPTWVELQAFFVVASDDEFCQWHSPAYHAALDRHEYDQHIAATRDDTLAAYVAPADVVVVVVDGLSSSSLVEPTYIRQRLHACVVLGEVLKAARVLTDPLPLPPPRTTLPTFPIKIALLGKPFTGRKTLSKLVCAKYNLAPLSVHSLLDAAIAARTDIGRAAADVLMEGRDMPNAIYISLLHAAINALDPAAVRGWVLDDFVSDVDEACDLERLLSGCVPGELPRTAEDRASRLAPGQPPPPLPATFFVGKSGLDMVFPLPIERTKLYRHCLGKLIDPVTHAQFHMHANPPPENATTRFRLQLWSDGIIAPENLSLHAQSQDRADRALGAWFRQYATLRHIDDRADAATAICDHIDHFVADQAAAGVAASRAQEHRVAMAIGAEEYRTRAVASMEAAIAAAHANDAAAQAALKAAEEAKAKKDELVALKPAVETTKAALDAATAAAVAFHAKERQPAAVALMTSVAPPLPLAEYVAALWATTEAQYERVVQRSLAGFRHVRERVMAHGVSVLAAFCAFVRRGDAAQRAVDAFQAEFNGVLEDMRYDDAVKGELHVRVDSLQDALLALIEAKGGETGAELARMLLADGWKELVLQMIVLLGQTCVQAEVDRFHASVHILVDGIAGFEAGLRPVDSTDATDVLVPPLIQVKDATSDDHDKESGAKKPAKKGGGGAAAAAAAVPSDEIPPTPERDTATLATKAIDTCKKLVQRYVKLAAADDDEKKDETAATSGGKEAKHATGGEKPADKAATHKSKVDLHHDKSGGGLPPSSSSSPPSPAALNAVAALQFELQLVQTRVHAIQARTGAALANVQDVLAKLETDLRAMLATRLQHERMAVQTLVSTARAAIEAHVALPYRLVVHTPVHGRVPPHRQELADTQVRQDMRQRILEKPPAPPYPIVEYLDEMYLSSRQLNELVAMLRAVAVETSGRHDVLVRPVLVDCLSRLASTSLGLPPVWKRATMVHFKEMGAFYDKKLMGVIKVPPLVNQMQAKHRVNEVLYAVGLSSIPATYEATPPPTTRRDM
ncbi:Aste57867_14758 [Aphanomyces stellatus]|uniref:Aste57867_14758 protein n=1 Tax=Aphanomyces stellatus TaxID=120398 RepID=A0A485L1U0_9STRA|nr:hypothetical protein As57867_014703 [Aphanomyces stellatus]VFT91576.1 Aste57867_14758 [Aphanomyces stellatus]